MKKVALSLFVIVSFILYSIYERGQTAVVPKTSQGSESVNPQTVVPSAPPPDSASSFKDGTYIGSDEDVFYGHIQIQATVSGGRITAVDFLKFPNDQQTSVMINSQMMPVLQQEAIAAQSSRVDIVTGATDSSEGFRRSLANALAKAK